MFRIAFAVALSFAGLATLNAGQIQIGGTNGLTSAYLTNPNANGCGGNCIAGSTTGWAERNYTSSLFANTSLSGGATTGTDSAGAGVLGNQGSSASAWSLTDPNNGGVQFSMLNDGVLSGKGKNYWTDTTAGFQQIVVPVGISGINEAWVMLNDYWGDSNMTAEIDFNFSDQSSNSASPDLVDAITLGFGSNGPLRSAMNCQTSTGLTTLPCNPALDARGNSIAAGSAITSSPSFTSGNATITADSLYSANYATTGSSTNGPFSNATNNQGSSGTVSLNDLAFTFAGNQYVNDYLVSITIKTWNNASAGTTGNNSALALSAITVNQAGLATPEPSTIFLFGSGFLGLALVAWTRRRKLS